METITMLLPSSQLPIAIELQRKRMKTCRLKVGPDRRVVLSFPYHIPFSQVETFLTEKLGWIEKVLQSIPTTVPSTDSVKITEGATVTVLGKEMLFSVIPCARNSVSIEDNKILLRTNTPDKPDRLLHLFEKWWRKEALCILEERVHFWLPVVGQYGATFPTISVRKMRTLWGCCHVTRHAISFNLQLLSFPLSSIDYVVLHELTHFLYPNHGKQFYAFLSKYMPDWKERKNKLNQSSCAKAIP